MSRILYLDLSSNGLIASHLEKRGIELMDLKVMQQEGGVWPNLSRRCTGILVVGASGLVDDNPELDKLLGTLGSIGRYIEVWTHDQPLDQIHRALISGVNYQFGLDLSTAQAIDAAFMNMLDHQQSNQFTA